MELQFIPGPVRWTEELSETCGVSCQNKFVKLVYLVGFIIRKFVTVTRTYISECQFRTDLVKTKYISCVFKHAKPKEIYQ
jgi:hypothetical protein